jgi:hypothetical protein
MPFGLSSDEREVSLTRSLFFCLGITLMSSGMQAMGSMLEQLR